MTPIPNESKKGIVIKIPNIRKTGTIFRLEEVPIKYNFINIGLRIKNVSIAPWQYKSIIMDDSDIKTFSLPFTLIPIDP